MPEPDSIDSQRLAYDDVGRGQPILFIHGYPLSRALWQPQVQALSAYARAIAPDLPGFGQSAPVARKATIDAYADDCAYLLKILGIRQKVIVCGLSMGGYVAFAFYRRYPEMVGGLILASTRAGADSAEGKANRDKAIALAQKEGAQAIARAMLPKMLAPQSYSAKPGLAAAVRAMMVTASLEGITGALAAMRDRPDSTDMLATIHVPTLILHGEQDQIMPPSEAEAMRAAIPSSALTILPNAGHMPNMEQPDAFNRNIIEFINVQR